MDAVLAAYLDGHVPAAQERVTWPNGLTFDFAAYLIGAPPPDAFVVSVRAILERDGQVLAFDDEGGTHVIPGGKREAGESFVETLEREIREETGVPIAPGPRQLGVIHLHLNSPRPAGSPYPYPDSLWLIYAASASPGPVAVSQDDWVREPRFLDAEAISSLPISAVERVFLEAARV